MKEFPRRPVLAGLGAFAFFLALAWLSDLDLRLARAAYAPTEPHWPAQGTPPWSWLHAYGEWPAAAAGLLGGLVWLSSYFYPSLRHLRGPGLYLFALLLLGPGLLVNTLGKGLTGRPRPMELLEFGGAWEFRRPLEWGVPGRGRSFLSGHASMGFFWFALGFMAEGRRRALLLTLAGGLGTLIGVGRLLQGGHFLSDVTLCGALMFTLAAALSPLLHWQPGPDFLRLPGVRPALLGALAGWLLIGQSIYEERTWSFRNRPGPPAGPFERVLPLPEGETSFALSLERGDIRVAFDGGEGPAVRETLRAWGLPGAKVRLEAGPLRLDQRLRGFLWDLSGLYELSLPAALPVEARLSTRQGRIRVAPLPEGRRVLLHGTLPSARIPQGFQPYGATGFLREGRDPLAVLTLEAPDIFFE